MSEEGWSPEVLRLQFPILQREINGQPLHYLDSAATTFSPRCVQEAMGEFESHSRSNIWRGMHQLGTEATDAYELARRSVAKYLRAASSDEIIFTSGTTYAVNLVAHSIGQSLCPGDEIVVSVAEHHSNFVPWQRICEQYGAEMKLLPVLDNGSLDLSRLDRVITERCRVVAVSHVSNVTGSITDLSAISRAARRRGAVVFVDGAQAAPHDLADVELLDVDFYAFSGHKCYGPTGIGVLWVRESILQAMPPFLTGGGMIERVTVSGTRYQLGNRRFEVGTPPVAQAVGLGTALEWLMALPWSDVRSHEQQLMTELLEGVSSVEGLTLLGEPSIRGRAPIFSFNVEGYHAHDICQVLDGYGVELRGGHHCAQPLMDVLGLTSTSRLSLGVYNNDADIFALVSGLQHALELLQ